MVEQVKSTGQDLNMKDLVSDTLAFFDEVYSLIPENHKQVPREYIELSTQKSKKKNRKRGPKVNGQGGLSLVDLKEKAQKRIMDI